MTLSILSILASLILPSAQLISKRNKELELRRSLRVIRNAIDDYKKTYDKACFPQGNTNISNPLCPVNKSGYPETPEVLYEGHDFGGIQSEKKKFLRRFPCDPFISEKPLKCEDSWGLRSYVDKSDSSQWGREDVYDVYSKSDGTAIDESKYKDW